MTYAQMAMKINIKLGGSNHKLSKKIVKDYLIKIMSPFSFLVLMLLIQREKSILNQFLLLLLLVVKMEFSINSLDQFVFKLVDKKLLLMLKVWFWND